MHEQLLHSAAIFLDGFRKGISGLDMQSAYTGIRKNLTEATLLPWRQGLPRIALDDFFHEKGSPGAPPRPDRERA